MAILLENTQAPPASEVESSSENWLEELCGKHDIHVPVVPLTVIRDTASVPQIGHLVGFSQTGHPLVRFEGTASHAPVEARTTVSLTPTDLEKEILLLFAGGDLNSPIVTGVVQPPLAPGGQVRPTEPKDIEVDGERIIFTGKKEIVLQCGSASIVLTRSGRILIRGAYVVSRASGVNRIKGGSVQIN